MLCSRERRMEYEQRQSSMIAYTYLRDVPELQKHGAVVRQRGQILIAVKVASSGADCWRE
jgi:hypothetical protein